MYVGQGDLAATVAEALCALDKALFVTAAYVPGRGDAYVGQGAVTACCVGLDVCWPGY